MLNKKNPGPTNRDFEYREVSLNIDGSIYAQNFKYQNTQKMHLIKATRGKFMKISVTMVLQT